MLRDNALITTRSPVLPCSNILVFGVVAPWILSDFILLRVFCPRTGTKVAVLLKGRSSTANAGTKVAVLLGISRCGSFPLLSAPHSL